MKIWQMPGLSHARLAVVLLMMRHDCDVALKRNVVTVSGEGAEDTMILMGDIMYMSGEEVADRLREVALEGTCFAH